MEDSCIAFRDIAENLENLSAKSLCIDLVVESLYGMTHIGGSSGNKL